ncbi:hypothetical protein [Maricaulis sp.]|uniref:hypothetical protein n=1 Tax=Maricaulis sp. TaxID=1486257 RepID=UPI003A91C158
MDIAAGINAVSAAIALTRSLSDAAKVLDAASMKLEMAELTGHLADAKLSLVEARDEIARLEAECGRIKDTLQEKANLVRYRGYHYPHDKDGQPIGTAYCPTCLTIEGRLFRLIDSRRVHEGNHCPN